MPKIGMLFLIKPIFIVNSFLLLIKSLVPSMGSISQNVSPIMDLFLFSSQMIEISGKDGFVFDSAHDEYESEPYHLLNAYYNHSINQFDLGFYAKNILDESYADRGFILGLEPPIYEEKLYKSFGPPREIGMSLTYSF